MDMTIPLMVKYRNIERFAFECHATPNAYMTVLHVSARLSKDTPWFVFCFTLPPTPTEEQMTVSRHHMVACESYRDTMTRILNSAGIMWRYAELAAVAEPIWVDAVVGGLRKLNRPLWDEASDDFG